jgi:hypothetical protein
MLCSTSAPAAQKDVASGAPLLQSTVQRSTERRPAGLS